MRSFVRIGAAVALACAGAVVAIGSSTAGAEQVTQEFEFTGEAQEFVVPAGVCSLTVDAFGAEGGVANDGAPGGEGGRATATIPVTPGETLAVYVGEEGHDGTESAPMALSYEAGDAEAGDAGPAALPADSEGGFNGGGDGGTSPDQNDGGGGGGGASDVRQGGNALENRVVVAGGGGGSGGDGEEAEPPDNGAGGDGGGTEGTAGSDSTDGQTGGGGGTQSAGGSADTGEDPTATPGELGQGGTGGVGDENDGGGGGGGGYFGGGGGIGSTGEGDDDGGGGGGGSGFGPAGTTFETGNQFGDGLVILTYDPAVQTCALPVVVEPTFTG